MEKKKPHYQFSEVQRVIEDRGVKAFTTTALSGASALVLSGVQTVALVLGLNQKNLQIWLEFAKNLNIHSVVQPPLPIVVSMHFSSMRMAKRDQLPPRSICSVCWTSIPS